MTLRSVLFSAVITSTALPTNGPLITVSPETLLSGQTAAVCVQSELPIDALALKAQLATQTALFFQPPGTPADRRCGLLAVPLATPPGKLAIGISWTSAAGPQATTIQLDV